MKTSICRTQVNNSIMCGYFCIEFIDFMLAGKTLIDYASLFSPYDFQGKNHFGNDGSQNYLVFQPMYKYFKMIGNTHCISESKYEGLSDEITEPPTTSDNSLAPTLSYIGKKTRVKFNGSCLK